MSKKNDLAAEPRLKRDGVPDRKYPTERLLRSGHLAGYQKDFAKAILTEPAYSISEARAALDKALKGGK